MTTSRDWRTKANTILDEHMLSGSPIRMTQDSFAKVLGISRQTLWRDKYVMQKFEQCKANSRSTSRKKSKDLRITELENLVTRLKTENGVLLLNFVLACTKLRDHNIDPRLYFSEVAADIVEHFPRFTPSQFYDGLKEESS